MAAAAGLIFRETWARESGDNRRLDGRIQPERVDVAHSRRHAWLGRRIGSRRPILDGGCGIG